MPLHFVFQGGIMIIASKKKFHKKLTAAAVLLLLANLLLFLTIWLLQKYDQIYFEQLLYQLKAPSGDVEGSLLSSAYIRVGLFGFAATFIEIMAWLVLSGKVRKKLPENKKYRRYCATDLCRFFRKRALPLSMAAFLFGLCVFVQRFDVIAYVDIHSDESDFIESHYTDPADAQLTFPDEKRNLIYIFLESMENTFADPSAGEPITANYIPELTMLADEHTSFSHTDGIGGAFSHTGTTWTAASMVSQTCGVHVKVPVGSDSFGGEDVFMPGVVSIGEILEDQGYRQTLLLGSDAEFHGRESYFAQHGNYHIIDSHSLKAEGRLPEDYEEWWGYEDEKLFFFAKEELLKLAEEDSPFNFTMLTADTHFPDGYVCRLCGDTYEEQYPNVLACSSNQIMAFIEWIQAQDFYENTTIILSGDHLTMDPAFLKDLNKDYVRTTYNCIINAPVEPVQEKQRQFAAFDMFPTTLAALGVEIEGNRLGLGTNLYSDQPTLTEQYGFEMTDLELQKKSAFYNDILLQMHTEETSE